MGSIYQNSYLTISATNSGDANARCLHERRKPVIIPYENTTRKQLAVRARRVLKHHPDTASTGGPARPIGPLTSRAWALQETVLSTRVLHYTATEVLFECKTSYRCECLPERKAWPTTPSLIPKAVASKNPNAVWQAWQSIVGQYTSRDLTVASDKLPAISGIASKIRKATHSDYIAGLWKHNLASDLLWSATNTSSHVALDIWRAPTFSWASLDVPVHYVTLDDEERESFVSAINLVSITVTPKGLNPLGTLQDARMTLRALIKTAVLASEQNNGEWTYALLIKGTSSIPIAPDCRLHEVTIKGEGGGEDKMVHRARSDEMPHTFTAAVSCMVVARYDNIVAGLVITQSQNHPGAWERLGTFAAGSESMLDAIEEEIILT